MSKELKAAANAARYLAHTVSTIRTLATAGADLAARRLFIELNERFPEACKTISAVEMELRQARKAEAVVQFGDITAPTAHEASIRMVFALNQELMRKADGRFYVRANDQPDAKIIAFELLGEPVVRTWPHVRVVTDTIDLEYATALRDWGHNQSAMLRDRGGPLTNQGGSGRPLSESALEALMTEDYPEILAIVTSDKTADDKMRAICATDRRFYGWKSPRWSDLLGVSEAAIRQTEFWKMDRKMAIGADRKLRDE